VAPVRGRHLGHLHRELPRRRQHQRPDRVPRRRERRVGIRLQPLEDGQDEGRRLAGARLGGTHEVAALEDERDRLDLDGRGRGEAFVGDRAEEFGRQAEAVEGHVSEA
jgi:hypothetical protein